MNVGDYVRTKKGTIYQFNSTSSRAVSGAKKYMVKSSPNIIDLIEVGDYVNGRLVYEIKENCVLVGYKCFKTEFDNEEEFLYQTIYANDIKSIVTKEQFESMEYKVGE